MTSSFGGILVAHLAANSCHHGGEHSHIVILLLSQLEGGGGNQYDGFSVKNEYGAVKIGKQGSQNAQNDSKYLK